MVDLLTLQLFINGHTNRDANIFFCLFKKIFLISYSSQILNICKAETHGVKLIHTLNNKTFN